MIKIALFLAACPTRGGVFQYNQSIVEALKMFSETDYAIEFIYTDRSWELTLKQSGLNCRYFEPNIFDNILKYMILLAPSVSLWLKLMRMINSNFHSLGKILKENADVCIFPSHDAYCTMFNTKSIVAIHDLMHRYETRFPEVGEKKEYKKREKKHKRTSKYASEILVDSRIGKKHVEESYNVNTEKIHILPYIAVNLKTSLNINVLEKYNLPARFIFYPAQFWKHKNHDNLIKALYKLKRPDIHLVLIGAEKNNYHTIRDLIQKLSLCDNVHVLGYIEDEEKILMYSKAVALVMPTFFGPTNIPPLEAFALGCPVAISGVYGIPEQVEDAAILFNPNNIDEIADAIQVLWDNDEIRKILIKNGFKMSSKWNLSSFTLELEQIIKKCVSN